MLVNSNYPGKKLRFPPDLIALFRIVIINTWLRLFSSRLGLQVDRLTNKLLFKEGLHPKKIKRLWTCTLSPPPPPLHLCYILGGCFVVKSFILRNSAILHPLAE